MHRVQVSGTPRWKRVSTGTTTSRADRERVTPGAWVGVPVDVLSTGVLKGVHGGGGTRTGDRKIWTYTIHWNPFGGREGLGAKRVDTSSS